MFQGSTKKSFLTCPATANPSARSDVVNQTCKQTWNAAMGVGPKRAAIDAARVTQNVAAMTLINSRKPGVQAQKKKRLMGYQL